MAGDSDGWGPDNRASEAPPVAFWKGGVFSRPPSIVTDPWTNGSNGGDKKDE